MAANSAKLQYLAASSAPTTAPVSSVSAATTSVDQHVPPVQSLAAKYATVPLPPIALPATQDTFSAGSLAIPVLRWAAWTVTRPLAFPVSRATSSREGSALSVPP